MANTMLDNLTGQLTILKSQIEGIAISFGEILMPKVREVVSKMQELADKIKQLSPEQKEQIVNIAAIAAAIGPLLVTGGKLLTGIGKMMQFAPQISTALQGVSSIFGGFSTSLIGALAPITAIVAVIGVLVAAFMNLWNNNEAFRTNMIATWESIKASFAGFIEQIQERLPAIQEAFTNFIEFVRPLWEAFCQVLAPMFESDGVNLFCSLFPLTSVFTAFPNYVCGKIGLPVFVCGLLLQAATVVLLARLAGRVYQMMLLYRGNVPKIGQVIAMLKEQRAAAKAAAGKEGAHHAE
jgi:phage-related protein